MIESKKKEDESSTFVLAKGFSLNGKLVGYGMAIISGDFTGDVSCTDLLITSEAIFSGNLQCNQLDVSGQMQGVIEAEKIVVRKTASINGEVYYSTLSMEGGCQVVGSIKKIDPKPADDSKNITSSIIKKTTDFEGDKEEVKVVYARFPQEIIDRLNQSTAGKDSAFIRTTDESSLPNWISLSPEKDGVQVDSLIFSKMKDAGERSYFKLCIEGEMEWDFQIPI